MLVLLSIAAAGGVGGQVGDSFAAWRCPQRDGVNCLYLLLRTLGYKGSYEQVVAALPGGVEQVSLGELVQAARRLGLPLVPVKMTIAELSELRSPTVILFEELGSGSGRFHLLLGFSPSQVHLVDGAYITRYQLMMPIDRFRREWTGFALIPQRRSPWPGRWFGGTLGGLSAVIVFTLASRSARRRLQ